MTKELGHTPDSLRIEVVKLHSEGKSIAEIAAITNKHYRTVARICRENYLGRKSGRPVKATDAEIDRIHRQLLANAISWKGAADKVGLSISQLRRRIAKIRKEESDKYIDRFTGRMT